MHAMHVFRMGCLENIWWVITKTACSSANQNAEFVIAYWFIPHGIFKTIKDLCLKIL
jgi:hypothetical protein